HAMRSSDLPHDAGRAHVRVEVRALETRIVAAEVVLGILLRAFDAAGEEAAAEGAERDEADAELAQQRDEVPFEIALPQRVLALQRGDRMYRMRAADRLLARFRQSEVTRLPLTHEIPNGAGDVFDRDVRTNPMLVE